MVRIRFMLVLLIALTAGAALSYGTYNYLQNVPVQTVSVATQPLVVAATDLQLGEQLSADDVRVVQFPADSVPEGVFSNIADVVGRALLTPVVKYEPILAANLASPEAGAGLPPIIPRGMRAMSVRVNDVIGVAGYVLPGTRVDVLATASPTSRREDTVSKLVLANVEVLAAGTRIERRTDDAQPMQVTVVTLLVSPDGAERLALASSEGKIQLALRNMLDQDKPETAGIGPDTLLGRPLRAAPKPVEVVAKAKPGPATPPPPPPPPATIEIIRGDKRTAEVVK